MKTGYSIRLHGSENNLTNLSEECHNCVSTCSTSNEMIQCTQFTEKRRRGLLQSSLGDIFLCTNDAVKSSRLFKEKQAAVQDILPALIQDKQQLNKYVSVSINRIVHNLVTLNAESRDAIYALIPQEEFSQPSRDQLITRLQELISSKPREIAHLLIDLVKNESLVKAEFSVFSKLFENEATERRPYHIHKIVMLILNTFWDDFAEMHVRIDIGTSHEKVFVDYDCLAATLIHIFQNTTKYIIPNSSLKIRFERAGSIIRLIFDMISLRVEPHEETTIFDEGYSGENPRKIGKQGQGLGLSLVRKLLTLTNGSITLSRDQDKAQHRTFEGHQYENNVFSLELPAYEG